MVHEVALLGIDTFSQFQISGNTGRGLGCFLNLRLKTFGYEALMGAFGKCSSCHK
jgi:hypothetical protein